MTESSTRLERAIEQLGAGLEPPPGWEARVLAAIEPRRRSWLVRGWFAIPALAAIALAVVLLPWPRREEPLALSAELAPSSQVMRGPSGAIRAIARGGKDPRVIWIYRDGHELVAACPGHRACQSSGDALSISLDDAPIGHYQVVALSSAAVLPAPTGSYERDLEVAIEAGAIWKLQELEVR